MATLLKTFRGAWVVTVQELICRDQEISKYVCFHVIVLFNENLSPEEVSVSFTSSPFLPIRCLFKESCGNFASVSGFIAPFRHVFPLTKEKVRRPLKSSGSQQRSVSYIYPTVFSAGRAGRWRIMEIWWICGSTSECKTLSEISSPKDDCLFGLKAINS